MKGKNVFGNSLTFLIAGVLAVMAFVRGPEQIWFLAGFFAVWVIRAAASVLRPDASRIKTRLRRMNRRISAYLESAYPGAAWEWQTKEPEKLAADGGAGRIRLCGVPGFGYADVAAGRFTRKSRDMLMLVPFAGLQETDGAEAAESGNGPPADPEVWYGIQGRKILEACIADLNSGGYSSLVIRENGDVCVRQAGGETVRDSFRNLPGKSVWQALARVIEKQGLSASVADGCIEVSW